MTTQQMKPEHDSENRNPSVFNCYSGNFLQAPFFFDKAVTPATIIFTAYCYTLFEDTADRTSPWALKLHFGSPGLKGKNNSLVTLKVLLFVLEGIKGTALVLSWKNQKNSVIRTFRKGS